MPRRAFAAVLPVLVIASACVHALQPRTYVPHQRTVAMQQREYLAKELVQGLPEDAFRRWYARDDTWRDRSRPFILRTRPEREFTVYDVGSEDGVAGAVAFKDGALDHWTRRELVQESVVSAWLDLSVTPPRVEGETLLRIAALNPQMEPLRLEDLPDPDRLCRFRAGDEIQTLVPLGLDREHGNRLEVRDFGAPGAGAPDSSILPAGTRLTIKLWNPIEGRRLVGDDGVAYRLDHPLGLQAFEPVLCPAGRCAPVGAEAVVTEDLAVAAAENGSDPGQAIAPGLGRLPVWMTPAGTLKAGSTVRIRRWQPCVSMEAIVEPAVPSGGMPAVVKVTVAPPGLFMPAGDASR